MSSAWAAVRFPDGQVRFGTYSGTSDILGSRLYDSTEEAWAGRDQYSAPDAEGQEFDVEIYSDYGGGFWWTGRAAFNVVTAGRAPHGIENQMGKWVEPRCEIHDGRPAWVDEAMALA